MSAPALPSLKWILELGHSPLSCASDEFITPRFRVQLRGPALHLDVECDHLVDPTLEAEATVQTYVESLGRALCHFFRPRKAGEPWPFLPHVRGGQRQVEPPEPRRLERALREARESVAFDDPTLRHCYRYMSQANIEFSNNRIVESLVLVYKLQESIEKHFGTEARAKRELALAGEIDLIGRLANDSRRDVRHPPRRNDVVRPTTSAECCSALEAAARLLRGLERHLRAASVSPLP